MYKCNLTFLFLRQNKSLLNKVWFVHVSWRQKQINRASPLPLQRIRKIKRIWHGEAFVVPTSGYIIKPTLSRTAPLDGACFPLAILASEILYTLFSRGYYKLRGWSLKAIYLDKQHILHLYIYCNCITKCYRISSCRLVLNVITNNL